MQLNSNWKSTGFNFLLAVIAIGVLYGAFSIFRQAVISSKESEKATERITELLRQKSELEQRIRELQTNEAMEREAKERLNLKLPGEEVVVIIPPPGDLSQASTSSAWQKFKSFVNNVFE